MMNKQHKHLFDESNEFENNEGQQSVLCCNGASIGCPSLYLSIKQAKQRLLNKGMSLQDFDSLMGFLKNFAREYINQELHNINNKDNEHE